MQTDEPRPGPSRRRAFVVPAAGHLSAQDFIGQLRALAERARRLPSPSHRDPEAFHVARDELGADLAIAAAALEQLLRRR